jgi:hypothetical protein
VLRVRLDGDEPALVSGLCEQVLDLIGDVPVEGDSLEELIGTGEPVDRPRDPVELRLLPDAYRDEPEAADEFRRLTNSGLRRAKGEALHRVMADIAAGSRTRGGGIAVELDEAGCDAWLPALTDIRLTLGTRIGVREDMDEERAQLEPGSRRQAELAAYDWLSWLQDAIVRGVSGG